MDRSHNLYDIMLKKGMDAIIVTERKNVLYFSGFSGSNGYIVATKKHKILVTDSRYTVQARLQCPSFTIKDITDFNINSVVSSDAKTGFENKSISYTQYVNFANKLGNLVPLDNLLVEVRSIKDHTEIQKISQAAQIADMAFSHIIEYMHEGMTEAEVSFELEMFMRKNGASSVSFESIIASGENGAMPHARPCNRKLTRSDFVVMDFGCVFEGYCSDMTRTVAVGDIDARKLEVYNTVLSVQKKCVEMAIPGAKCSDIHNYSSNVLNGKYSGCYGHGLGHGVGTEVHELPNLNPKSEYVLIPGNIITVEPGVYIDGFCGVRIEDLVLITDNGNKILSNSTKELLKIV